MQHLLEERAQRGITLDEIEQVLRDPISALEPLRGGRKMAIG